MRREVSAENDRVYLLIQAAVEIDPDTGEPADSETLYEACTAHGWAVHDFMRYPVPK